MEVAVPLAGTYNAGAMSKVRTKVNPESFRLTDTASKLLQSCADEAGISKAAVLEQAIREYAKRKGVTLTSQQPSE